MTLSPTQNWIDAFSVADCAPIVLVEVNVNRRLFVSVDDFSIASSNEIQITVNATVYTFIAGTSFVIGGSNESMATNAANAINIHTSNLFSAWATGAVIEIVVAKQSVGVDLAATATTGASVAVTGSSMAVRPGSAPTSYKFVSGSRPFLNGSSVYPNSIDRVGTIGASIDPVSRSYSAGAFDITWFDDGRLRDLVLKYPLRGNSVSVYLGTLELSEANFLKLTTLYVKDVTPVRGERKLRMELEDVMWTIGSRTWKGEVICLHPLEVIAHVLSQVRAVAGTDYDATTLTPLSASPATAHHVLSRMTSAEPPRPEIDNAVTSPIEVRSLISELCVLTGGSWYPNANGLYGHRAYDDTTAIARTLAAGALTGHDCEFLETPSTVENTINVVTITYGHNKTLGPIAFVLADDTSINQFGEHPYDIETRWLAGIGTLALFETLSTYATVAGTVHGIAGCGGLTTGPAGPIGPTVNQAAGYQLSTSRRAILHLFTFYASNIVQEYVACHEARARDTINDTWDTPFDNARYNVAALRKTSAHLQALDAPVRYYFDSNYNEDGFTAGREGFGTSIQSMIGPPGFFSYALDATIPWEIAKRILRRFKYGCPRVVVRCSLRHVDLEIGDFVALSGDDTMLRWRHDGAEATTKWEITRRDIELIGSTPHVEIELAFAKDSWVPALSVAPTPGLGHLPSGPSSEELITDNALVDVYIDSDGDGLADTGVTRI